MKGVKISLNAARQMLTKAKTPEYRREEIRARALARFDVEKYRAPHENKGSYNNSWLRY